MKKQSFPCAALVLSLALAGCGSTDEVVGTVAALEQRQWNTTNQSRVSIHDPSITSIIDENGDEVFYIFGSHLAQARSTDLLSWDSPFDVEYQNMDNNIIYGNTRENLAETFQWAGYDDADSAGGFALWAPDVIWNPNYVWADGSVGAYMIYYSASSTWRRSAIGFAVAPTIEGPYAYGGTIIYSGFTYLDATDGSDRNTNWAATNIPGLIESGVINEFSENWAMNSFTYNNDYAPNAIDPTLFYDSDENLWMVYGSWSGGIFLLEIDEATGVPLYPGEDSRTEDGRTIDRYFGIKLFGGFHQSGEGPYIIYDPDTEYYYLFITYGALQALGGYNMRLFRSQTVEGPYLDAQGNSPILENGENNFDFGIKLAGNYQFSNQPIGYRAPGHNSVIRTQDGRLFNVFHTRFDVGNEHHQVRVHSMFMNQSEWPVMAPFEYLGDDAIATGFDNSQVAGSYEIINHGTDNGNTMIPSQTVQFGENGEITGDVTGNWSYSGTDGFLTLEIGGVRYDGVLLHQLAGARDPQIETTFSSYGQNNESIWGLKLSS